MAKLIYIFVGGNTFVDKAIQHFSHAEKENITHVAMLIRGSTLESSGIKDEDDPYPGTWEHRKEKYFGNQDAKFISIEVNDLYNANDKSRKMLGTPYGYDDCISVAIKDMLDIDIPDSEITSMCAGTGTEIGRAAGLDILPNIPSGRVTPVDLYNEIMSLGGIDITEKFRRFYG